MNKQEHLEFAAAVPDLSISLAAAIACLGETVKLKTALGLGDYTEEEWSIICRYMQQVLDLADELDEIEL